MKDLVSAAAVAGLVALTCAGGARAEGPHVPSDAAVEEAKQVYEQAANAYEARRYSEAIRLFHRADHLKPNPAFDFNVGLAYEDMGDPARALASYRAYVRRAPDAPDRAEVDVRIQRLERVLQDAGVQQVTITSNPPGARFEIDGTPIGVTPWTGEIERGFHRVTLALAGYQPEERTFDLPPERAIDVPITLTAAARSNAPTSQGPSRPTPCVGTCLDAVDASSWLIASAGVLTLGGALAFELHRAEREAEAQSEPNQLAASRLYDEAFFSQKWATALALTGGALVATGVTLAIFDIHDAKHPEPFAWQVSFGPQGCAVAVAQQF